MVATGQWDFILGKKRVWREQGMGDGGTRVRKKNRGRTLGNKARRVELVYPLFWNSRKLPQGLDHAPTPMCRLTRNPEPKDHNTSRCKDTSLDLPTSGSAQNTHP